MFFRFEAMDLVPEDTPCIKFQADATQLRNSIREFGKVGTSTTTTPMAPAIPKPLSPLDAFAPSHLGAASLPNPFEEYEDDEHHVLYKTVQDVQGASVKKEGTRTVGTHLALHMLCDSVITLNVLKIFCYQQLDARSESLNQCFGVWCDQIQVSIPRMAAKPSDWLFMPAADALTAPTSPPVESRFVFPPFQATEVGQQWLAGKEGAVGRGGKGLGMSSSAASLQQWLLDLQHQATMEEDEEEAGFELLSPGPCNKLACKLGLNPSVLDTALN